MQILLLLVAMAFVDDAHASTSRFYDGVYTGCGGATVLLLRQQGHEVTENEVIAFCDNVAQMVWEHGLHDDTR